ncbi:MAG: glycosyltransferase family 9 protein [Nitrospirae bacterium]|nr:glycosyltransferase family 9 protein [Nitrospirota bacterium]
MTPPNKILILNLNRMGDQLQALPFYWAVKQNYPESHLSVFVDGKGEKGEVVRWLSPPVDEFVPLDLNRLRPPSGSEPPIAEGSKYFKELAAEMRSRSFDLIVNLSHGKFSGLLMSFFQTPTTRTLGHVIVEGQRRVFQGDWLTYLFTMVATRRLNRFHIVDLYIRGCGLGPPEDLPPLVVPEPDRAWADAFLRSHGFQTGHKLVAVQPGASEYRKRWEPEQFAEALALLACRPGLDFLVLGAPSERDLWEKMKPRLPAGTMDGIGTTLEQARALLARSSLLITNDTGPMHLASSLGVPCVVISLGSVYYPETFGYGPGHLILQPNIPCAPCSENLPCSDTVCHRYIHPEDVATGAELLLGLSPTRDPIYNGHCTFFRSGRDADGMLFCTPLRRMEQSRDGLMSLAYREMWKVSLDFKDVEAGWRDLKESVDVWYGWNTLAGEISPPLPNDLLRILDWSRAAQQTARELEFSLFQDGADTGGTEAALKQLVEWDQRIVEEGYRNPLLQPLLRQYRFERERIYGGTAVDWAQMSQIHLGTLERRCQTLQLYLDRLAERKN